MNKSDSITKIASALAQAQHNIGAAVKEAANPFFKSRYADLGSVMAVCKAPLLEQGVSVLQLVGKDDTGGYLETVLLHESGEFISDRMPLVCAKQHDPQAMGSAITYARRYALQSALFIPAEDDDGEAAQQTIRAAEERQEHREKQANGVKPAKAAPPATLKEVREIMQVGDWRDVKIHFGKNKGVPLGELNSRQLEWYANDWLDGKETSTKAISEDDRFLIEALRGYKRSIQDGIEDMKQSVDNDEIPMAPVEPETADSLPF